MVELIRPDTSVVASVFTDEYGRFLLSHLVPGTYSLKATGTLFLPTLRENFRSLPIGGQAVNLTLSTVMEAFQWLPAKRRSVDEPDDEWAWTLRSAANRPLLRMLENGPLVVVSDMDTAPVLKARVILRGGRERIRRRRPASCLRDRAVEAGRSPSDPARGHRLERSRLGRFGRDAGRL